MRTRALFSSVFSVFAALLVTSSTVLAQSAMTPRLPDNNFGGVNLPMAKVTCNVQATVKYIDATHNEVTYSLEYTNSGEKINDVAYTIRGSTEARLVTSVNARTTVQNGTHKVILPHGRDSNTVNFITTGGTKITFTATVGGKACAGKTLTLAQRLNPDLIEQINSNNNNGGVVIDADAVADARANTEVTIPDYNDPNGSGVNDNGGMINANGNGGVAPAPSNVVCKVIAEGSLSNNTVLIGAALDVSNTAAGSHRYTVRGFNQSSSNDIREYVGNYQAASAGNAFVLNGVGGFRFEVPLTDVPMTYTVTGTYADATCSSISFAVPAKGAVATVTNTQTGGSVQASNTANDDVRAFGQSDADAQRASQLALASTSTDAGADDNAATPWATYGLYAALVAIGGLVGYGVYRLGRRHA